MSAGLKSSSLSSTISLVDLTDKADNPIAERKLFSAAIGLMLIHRWSKFQACFSLPKAYLLSGFVFLE